MRRRVHRAPHHAVRYAPVVRALRALPPGARVLEVGSGVEGLGAFWPGRFVGVDRAFHGPRSPNLLAVLADATRLPFADRAFDLVVCVDVLAEIPRELLEPVCAEIGRVARGRAVVLCVSGPDANAADRRLLERLGRQGRRPPDWLVDEVRTGVPDPEPIRDALADFGPVRMDANMSVAWFERLFALESGLRRARMMTLLQPLVRGWGRRGARELPGTGPVYRHRFLLEIQPTPSPPRARS